MKASSVYFILAGSCPDYLANVVFTEIYEGRNATGMNFRCFR